MGGKECPNLSVAAVISGRLLLSEKYYLENISEKTLSIQRMRIGWREPSAVNRVSEVKA